MEFIYLGIFLFLYFVSLFILFEIAKNDFVLLRNKVELKDIFNVAFISTIFAIVTGRVLFILEQDQSHLLDPLPFFHFIRFPGFSFLGLLLGGMMILSLLVKQKDALARVYDIFAISFLPVLFFGFFTKINILQDSIAINALIIVFLLFLFFFLLVSVIQAYQNYVLRDGSIFFIISTLCYLLEILLGIFAKKNAVVSIFSVSQIISIIALGISIILLIRNESIASYVRGKKSR